MCFHLRVLAFYNDMMRHGIQPCDSKSIIVCGVSRRQELLAAMCTGPSVCAGRGRSGEYFG